MAIDLAGDPALQIVVADRDVNVLKTLTEIPNIKTQVVDVTELGVLESLVRQCDLCINALPGFMGFDVLREVIDLGKNIVDIAFSPEDPLTLNERAKEKGVTALVDCGVAPGMSNLLVGYAASLLPSVKNVRIWVGGLPKERHLPWEYKAVFSPIDVIEEYTRPARLKENGQIVIREALSEPELLDFPGIGTLEAFNTDGLRTLLFTIDAPNMAEKTLRYPGHRDKILLLKQAGFLDEHPIQVKGHVLSPLDVTAQVLIKQWELKEGEEDLTVMRVDVQGETQTYRFEVLDRYDRKSGLHSMARTTGFTATTFARAVLNGMITQKGILPPEKLGSNHELVKYVLDALKKRGIHYTQKVLKTE
jgi:saccharopine dehydrogenase-like NADP-dependent oxidoreductase